MCGITGIIAGQPVQRDILEGLRRLEYRGYDSAGIVVIDKVGHFQRLRAEGKLRNLEDKLVAEPIIGNVGIGHTRWATHGVPNTRNAHPHMTGKVAVVHNGIIENYRELREELIAAGYSFASDTDTEVVPVLLTQLVDQGKTPEEAFRLALKRLDGAFALAALFTSQPDTLFGARRGAPLAVGAGADMRCVASDPIAVAGLATKIAYLEDGDWVIITREKTDIFDREDRPVTREWLPNHASSAVIGKGHYRHFMLKEIYEQPHVIGETLSAYYDPVKQSPCLPALPFDAAKISKITLVACGTSYYAASVAKYWLEQLCRIPVEVDIASEFRYRDPVLVKGGVFACISQSGETADTLAALRHAKAHGQHTVAIVNVAESTMAREADAVLRTYAGPEIGVASTKAFTAQLVTLASATLALAGLHGQSKETISRLSRAFVEVPALVSEILADTTGIEAIAHEVAKATDAIFMGRGTSYPIALEGALKLKEISYIHAEAYAAGELKHGPIALIDEHMPVVVIAPHDALFEKTASNLQEVRARGGRVILISDRKGVEHMEPYIDASITLPECDPFVAPLLYALPVQLLAYYVAVIKGTDVDQPRNLAKSVTVE